jgi:hypothetical protein
MIRVNRLLFGACVAVALVFGGAIRADASIIVDGGLALDTDPAAIYQQTSSSPCVIGGNNCQNGAFPMFTENGGGTHEYDDQSPFYTTSQITDIVGSTAFTVGLDYNQDRDAQYLYSFSAYYCTGLLGTGTCTNQTWDLGASLPTNNNGVGYSDFLLSGFTIPLNTQSLYFTADWLGNDGADRYFLIGADAPNVPEPATLSLFGLSLLGIGRRLVRRKA